MYRCFLNFYCHALNTRQLSISKGKTEVMYRMNWFTIREIKELYHEQENISAQ